MDLKNSKRIIIIGSGGSGKSTLAKKLGIMTGIPVIHLDKEFWKPNWVETPRDEWIEKQNNLIKDKEWIIDGNYGRTMELRFIVADTVIFLDINRWICIFRAIERWVTNIGKTRTDMGEGCPEKIDFEFLKWIYSFPNKGRKKILSLVNKYSCKNIIILKNRKEINALLELNR